MRHLPVVLALAFAGIHCSAEVSSVAEATGESEIVAPRDALPRNAPAPEEQSSDEAAASSGKSAEPTVTSSVTDATGATYVAGTFTGGITLGGLRMKSRGEADVFLMKTSADGSPVWARTIGSRARESAPRVSVDADTGRVTVIGMTAGEMDCGDGPLATYAETFFLCTFYGRDGTSLESAAFPTGRQ